MWSRYYYYYGHDVATYLVIKRIMMHFFLGEGIVICKIGGGGVHVVYV